MTTEQAARAILKALNDAGRYDEITDMTLTGSTIQTNVGPIVLSDAATAAALGVANLVEGR